MFSTPCNSFRKKLIQISGKKSSELFKRNSEKHLYNGRYPLVVQHAGRSSSIKLLLLQNALKVLHPLLQVPHVSGKVAVQKAHRVAEHRHSGTDPAFIALVVTRKGAKRGEGLYKSVPTDAKNVFLGFILFQTINAAPE